ncbi:hypothetical protein NDU88_005711 [Pleurodeles waltl]|uniref:Uncharacterized protein n=1 Tax=Pleurodeles waltl TaxID=8319 RepID=A0AAV7PL71_PLEWA|nr:hypothetical protein NDU88_005711 [Pleurodeles waltl]
MVVNTAADKLVYIEAVDSACDRNLEISMAGYDDQAEDLYYFDDTSGSFDQDLVYALDAGVRHSVNQALVQAIQPIKHHLLVLVDQQTWTAPVGAPSLGDPSFAAHSQSAKQTSNPHAADFQSLLRNMAKEHDYNAGSLKKAVDAPASSSASSDHSSEQENAPPRKHKKKAHHQEAPTPKVLTFEPEDIVHPRSSLWLPPPEVADYVEAHIRHGFDKDIRSRLSKQEVVHRLGLSTRRCASPQAAYGQPRGSSCSSASGCHREIEAVNHAPTTRACAPGTGALEQQQAGWQSGVPHQH